MSIREIMNLVLLGRTRGEVAIVSNKDPSKSFFFSAVHAECARPVWFCLAHRGVAAADLPEKHQDTFLSIHKNLADADPAKSFIPWSLGFARRQASNYRKARDRRAKWAPDFEAETELLPSEEPGPETELLHEEQRYEIAGMLESLPEEEREVFLLSEIDGATYAEIAGLLKVSARIVKRRHMEARALMAAALARYAAGARRERGKPPPDPTF